MLHMDDSHSSEDKPPKYVISMQVKARFIIILSSRVYEGNSQTLNPNIPLFYYHPLNIQTTQHSFCFMTNGSFRLTFTVHLTFKGLYFLLGLIFFGCWVP